MTGGPLPPGADSVVRVEDTDVEATEGRVAVLSDRDRGRNVRPGGQDMRAGDHLLEAGECCTPGVLAVAAAAGRSTVGVHRRPRLAVLTSGDELRGPDRIDEVREGRGIPDSNGPMLLAAAAELGVDAALFGPVADRPSEVRAQLETIRDGRFDLLVTVGGASMGATDHFRTALDALGADLDFWRVQIRPGSPFSASTVPRSQKRPLPVLGLPGNPASAFVTFHLFVRPALLKLAGHGALHPPEIRAHAGASMSGSANLTHFVRVRLTPEDGGWVAIPTGPQGSGLVRGLATADGLAVLPKGTPAIASGDLVTVLVLRLPPAPEARHGRPPETRAE